MSAPAVPAIVPGPRALLATGAGRLGAHRTTGPVALAPVFPLALTEPSLATARDTGTPPACDSFVEPDLLNEGRVLLVIPDLIALDLPALIRKVGYPGTAAIPPVSRILSLLALKLTATPAGLPRR